MRFGSSWSHAPGDAGCTRVSGELELRGLDVVALEGAAGRRGLVAVELDYQVVVRPVGVDFVAGRLLTFTDGWGSRARDEREEPALELFRVCEGGVGSWAAMMLRRAPRAPVRPAREA